MVAFKTPHVLFFDRSIGTMVDKVPQDSLVLELKLTKPFILIGVEKDKEK